MVNSSNSWHFYWIYNLAGRFVLFIFVFGVVVVTSSVCQYKQIAVQFCTKLCISLFLYQSDSQYVVKLSLINSFLTLIIIRLLRPYNILSWPVTLISSAPYYTLNTLQVLFLVCIESLSAILKIPEGLTLCFEFI